MKMRKRENTEKPGESRIFPGAQIVRGQRYAMENAVGETRVAESRMEDDEKEIREKKGNRGEEAKKKVGKRETNF